MMRPARSLEIGDRHGLRDWFGYRLWVAAGWGGVPVAPVNTVAPVISGTPTTGQTLTATTGTWTGTAPITYAYQWKIDGANVGGNAATYALTDTEIGAYITCVVTGTNAYGSDTGTSNSLGPVTSADLRTQIEGLRAGIVSPNGRQSVAMLNLAAPGNLPPGCTISGNTITFSGDGITIEDWDFTDKSVEMHGTDQVIQNCYWGPVEVVASSQYPISIETTAVNAIVRYNTIDGFDGYGGPATMINIPYGDGGATTTGARDWLIEYNRFLYPNSDVIKSAGSGIARWNYYGPLTNYPAGTAAWSAGTTYAAGDFVLSTVSGRDALFRSFAGGNIGHAPAATKVNNAYWESLDPHGDANTVTSAIGLGVIITRNLIDWDTTSIQGVGTTQGCRVTRNTGTNPLMGPVDFSENVISGPYSGFYAVGAGYIRAWTSTTTYALGGLCEDSGTYYVSLQNSNVNNTPASSPTFWDVTTEIYAPGPIGFTNNWIGVGVGASYHAILADTIDIWSGNVDAVSGTSITGPTLRSSPSLSAAANTVAPTLSGTMVTGSTITMAAGTWTGYGAPALYRTLQRSADGSTGWTDVVTTGDSYLLVPGDATYYFRVSEYGVNATGAATALSSVSAQVTAGYSQNFVNPNNTAKSYINFGGSATKFELGIWLKPITYNTVNPIISGSSALLVKYSSSGVITVQIWDSAATNVYTATSAAGAISGTGRKFLYISLDWTTQTVVVKVNHVAITMTPTVGPSAGTSTLRPARNHELISVTASILAADVSDFYANYHSSSMIGSSAFWNGGTPPDPTTFIGTPKYFQGGTMKADADAGGNTAHGWNDGYNLGSGTIVVTATGYIDA